MTGHLIDERIERREHATQKIVEALGRILVPVTRKEVIEKDVADHTCVMSLLNCDDSSEGAGGRMCVRELVDLAMFDDSLSHSGRESISERAADKVTGQIAEE